MATTDLGTPATTSLANAGLLVLRIGVGATMIQARGGVGSAAPGDRRGAADMDIAERVEPDPLHRPGRLAERLPEVPRADAKAPHRGHFEGLLRLLDVVWATGG
ncbi:hypothetical protein [Mycolicibacterium moriokaense]|uniref:hypothetical protein n=1 Tax=Mycolicibacterium moriokaense TaxID=39691 RepID=UPI0011B44583|nr:hypothetical protein [Mycolicibacterium moriokaense]